MTKLHSPNYLLPIILVFKLFRDDGQKAVDEFYESLSFTPKTKWQGWEVVVRDVFYKESLCCYFVDDD